MTAHKRAKKRCFYSLNDRRLKILDLTPESLAVVSERYACPNHMLWDSTNPHSPAYPLGYLSPRWNRSPEPINIAVQQVAKCDVSGVAGLCVSLIDKKLADALGPYCRDIYIGSVTRPGASGRLEPTRFVTMAAPLEKKIQSDRGKHCQHVYHPCCGVSVNTIGWAKGAIVERTLDDRLVYVDQDGRVLVADELVEKLDLKHRFPKLWLQRIDVVLEPLDKETLPGDPGWDGVLRRTYSASLGVSVYTRGLGRRASDEQAIYGEFLRRLNGELEEIGAERASRDRGSHGSCFFYARGKDVVSLKQAVLRSLNGWRVGARFSVSLHDFESGNLVEDFKIDGGRIEPTGVVEKFQRIRDQAKTRAEDSE